MNARHVHSQLHLGFLSLVIWSDVFWPSITWNFVKHSVGARMFWPFNPCPCRVSIREILVITWPYARQPAPQGNQCEMSYFLASVGACNLFHLIIDIHIVVNWQLSTQGICWTVSRDCIGARMATHRGHVFFGNFPLTSCWLLIVGRLKFMFLSHMVIDLWICLQLFKSPLSEVNPKSINGSFAFTLAKSIYSWLKPWLSFTLNLSWPLALLALMPRHKFSTLISLRFLLYNDMNAMPIVIGVYPWSIRVHIHGWRLGKLVFFVLFNMALGFENVCEILSY